MVETAASQRSTILSTHRHNTCSRIFVGPTPRNWTYKKKSWWFSKSRSATGTRGRVKSFRASLDVIGPTHIDMEPSELILEETQQTR